MTTPIALRSFLLRVVFALGAVCSSASVAAAAGAPPGSVSYVVYSPGTVQTMQGDTPFVGSYLLSVTSPTATPAGAYDVTLSSAVVSAPLGADLSAAASFLSFSATKLSFTGPSQTQSVTVTLTIPFGSVTGDFSYLITTSGWPAGVGIVDLGTTVNMTVQSSLSLPLPTVSIANPADNTTYGRLVGGDPISVPIMVTAAAGESATLMTLTAEITGVANDGSTIPSEALGLVTTGLGSANASGSVTYSAVKAGVYTISAMSTNSQGQATTTSTFVVKEGRPPTVTITEPPAASYDYYLGSPPLSIPFTFVGESFETGITKLTATIDGQSVVITPADLGALFATGTGTLPGYTTAGSHILVVTAEDIFGIATASTTFSVTVIKPSPVIVINEPANGTVLTLASGTTAMDVPFTFTTSTSPNFTISSINAALAGIAQAVPSQTGLGTVQAVGAGTMNALPVGTYVLTAYGVSAGIQVQASTTFTINKPIVVNTPPTVSITNPPAGSSYTLAVDGCSGGGSLSIPLTFTGTSTTLGAVITKLTATLDGTALAVSSSTLNQKIATGTASLVVSTAGTHTIVVTAVDAYGTATATRTFNVTIVNLRQKITGVVFFDVNFNGTCGVDEYGLGGVPIKLLNATGQTVATSMTLADGTYSFTVLPGAYRVSAGAVTGMSLTTANDNLVTVYTSAVTAPDIGFGLYFASIRTLCANGFTIGYWKNNVDKAIANKTAGTQVSATAIASYTSAISSLALDPFSGLTMSSASSFMGSTSSVPRDLLAKQLVGSEYNYANGGFIGGDRRLTYAFVYYCEYVFKNSSSYSGTYILWVKDWCDAYNNSHGGKVLGPVL